MKPEEIVAIKKMTPAERAEFLERTKQERIKAGNEAFRQEQEAKLKGMIQKKDLIDGAYYEGECRNATIARWNGKKEVFVYLRTKFNETFPEEIKHPDDEQHYDVFIPQKLIKNPATEIPMEGR